MIENRQDKVQRIKKQPRNIENVDPLNENNEGKGRAREVKSIRSNRKGYNICRYLRR